MPIVTGVLITGQGLMEKSELGVVKAIRWERT
jgi:hypothetical protein